MSIISPEEERFSQGQARFWKAQLKNLTVDDPFAADCHWEFYYDNDSDKKTPYKQMDTTSSVSKESPDLCGFTSTFIDISGKVTAKLQADIKDNNGDILKSFTAEKEYMV